MRTLREQLERIENISRCRKTAQPLLFLSVRFPRCPPHHWASASGRNPQAYIKAPISPRVQFESREQFGSKNRLEAE